MVDNFVRRKEHPELDPSVVTIDQLANAVMAVAHCRCWANKLDPYGKFIVRTMDAKFIRGPGAEYPCGLLPDFARAALGRQARSPYS